MALWDATSRSRAAFSHPWLAGLLFALDERLRRRLAVVEYSHSPSCIFRLEIARAERPLQLRAGAQVRPGDRVARLHFWNEHVPVVPPGGATIAWAGRMRNAIAAALHELADYLAARSDLADVVAICADVPSGTRAQSAQLARIMARYGFEAVAEPERLTLGERLHRFGENILISLIVLAQNAAALRADTLRRTRLPIYLSRHTLERRFGAAAAAPKTGTP